MRSHGRSRNISYPVPRVVQRDNHWPRRTPAKRARAVAGSGDASTLYKLTTRRPNHETSSKRECRKLVTISEIQCSRTTKQKPNTKETSSTKTHFKPTIGLITPFCVEKRNIKKKIPLACRYLCKSIQYNMKQNPNTKATSNTKTHYKPTIVLEIPFCVEKRNIKNSHTANQV